MKKTSQLPTLQILLILLVGLTFIQTATAQQTDTLSVYFQFGEWKIQKSQVRRIEAIPRVIYTNDLDSVHYIGMADSVGSLKDNLKLGEKRAQEVSRAVSPFLQTKPPYRVYSMGEQRGDAGESRRVDVIFFSPELIPNDQVELPPSDTILRAPLCLKRADTLLHRSHIYSERERRRSYVTIETNYVNIVKDSLFYCARRLGTSARGDSIEIYPIKWQVGKTYGIGNKKQDKYCRVDKRDFDEFELFTVDTGNCRGCAFSEFEYARNRRASSEKCRMADRFLMNHLEVKRKRFRSGLVNVRVPKTYVIKNERYYLGNSSVRIEWRETKAKGGLGRFFTKVFKRDKRGKGAGYYYTDLPMASNYCLYNIFRDMKCCPEEQDDPGEHDPICAPYLFRCGGLRYGGAHIPYFGVSYTKIDQTHLLLPHIGVERMTLNGFRYSAQVGINNQLKLVPELAGGYDLFVIPSYQHGGLSGWSATGEIPRVVGFYSIYTGSSVMTFENKEKRRYLNQFTYLGFTYYAFGNDGFIKPYVQVGVRHDYLNASSTFFKPQVEIGFRLGWHD